MPAQLSYNSIAIIAFRSPSEGVCAPRWRSGSDLPFGCTVIDDRAALRERIREASDIVEVVGSYLSVRQAGPLYKALCPFHNDTNPSLTIDPRRQRFKCWACGKGGDVFTFIQEHTHVTFLEALELLAHRAGISLEKVQKNVQGPSRAGMFDVMRWAAEQFQKSLLDSTQAEAARDYLGERQINLETIRHFGLGYAPASWDWLVNQAASAKKPADLLETVGLIAKRNEGRGYYDRFRDRVIFPVRDVTGRIVGFGGRILPSSPVPADRPPPKYYNSAETPIFSKSDQLYGIDRAKQAAATAGYLAIVEGYTDVLMAHQHGICNVVATMGTALNARHIKKLKHVASRVVLVFDADAGGDTGVDRALEVFVSNDLDLRIATLPEGLDPCDLLVQSGPEPFRHALDKAIDVFEYKLQRVWAKYASAGLDGHRQVAEEMLSVMAMGPAERTVKMELMTNRLAHRLQIKEEILWARLRDLRATRKNADERSYDHSPLPSGGEGPGVRGPSPEEPKSAPAAPHERELVELLLAEPTFVQKAKEHVPPDELEHPGLRKVIEAIYRLDADGLTSDLDHLHGRLDNERIWAKLHDLRENGLEYPDRPGVFQKVLERFRAKKEQRRKQAIQIQIQDATDPAVALALLRELREQK